VRETDDATGKFAIIINEAKYHGYPLYLIIDEYDNFTNTVLNEQGEGPREMIDPNTKTDYKKMRKLIQLDKLDGDRKGVIKTIAETPRIETLRQGTQLHKIIIQFDGWKLYRIDEVTE